MKKIYPCVTTLTKNHWIKQIKEINKYHLKEAAVYLTGLSSLCERQKLYRVLDDSCVKYVPHLHIRTDMLPDEISWFYNKYRTRQFNTHCSYFKELKGYKYIKTCFLLESTYDFQPELINKVAGYCVDIAHLYDTGQKMLSGDLRKKVSLLLKNGIKPKANHLSALLPDGRQTHLAGKFSEFDYLKTAPKQYFAKTLCLELENSITDQLKFIKYISSFI